MTQAMQSRPTFLINPSLHPSFWQGDDWGFRGYDNPNRINSIYLGTFWNLMCTPQRIGHLVLKPLIQGRISSAVAGVAHVASMFGVLLVAGLMGKLIMLPYDRQVLSEAFILDEDESAEDIAAGNIKPVRLVSEMEP